ncbi:hypothetical protein [Allokutzneria albata]|uniref:Uncharacterized protein n=1 Tax=Allokutzneria albata TaxID=211114 RepID=A0A1G9RD44_ALLAB|nr:hypothetical protein [Allokutzneria albata]SDM20980.1 hypothetical protein SAMN04489726_0375 [Allokutzneria albata]
MDQAAATPIYDELVDEIFKGITASTDEPAEAEAETSGHRHREAS